MINKKTYIEELLEENGLMVITREDYEWLIRQNKLKIKLALKIMEILGEDKEGIEVQNQTETKLKGIEELYRE